MTERVWIITDECGEGWCVFPYVAETRGKARMHYAAEMGVCWDDVMDVSVRRCPALDGLALTNLNLARVGLIHWAHCVGCSRTIGVYHDGPDNKRMFLESYDDHGQPRSGSVMDDELYCSAVCSTLVAEQLERRR